MLLSKSDYILFLRHPAWLWLKKKDHSKLPKFNPSIKQRMDDGYEFEGYAEQLFPDAKKIRFLDRFEDGTMLSQTSAAWADGARCVSQGQYQSGELACITDILEAEGNGYILTEIKSSNSAKSEHELDLAFQKVVLEEAGYKIHQCRVAHVNSSYVRDGEIDPRKLVTFTDVTENVEKKLEKTKSNIGQALAVLRAENIPDIDPSNTASNAFPEWLEIRKSLEPHLDIDSIYHLPKISSGVAKKLTENNISLIRDINDASLLSHGAAKYWRAFERKDRYIDTSKLKSFLDEITYPVYYLDYETSSSAVPVWNRTAPYQQVPFQYSVHIKKDLHSEAEHFEYLHEAKDNPMDGLLEKLIKDICDSGSVIVWNKSFEMDRNTEMAKYASEYEGFLSNINLRVIDLMDPFKDEAITDPAFRGSNSIKDVLPVMVPNFSYNDLDIKDGGSAASDWKIVTLQDGPHREKVHADLRKYCARDTEAMVLIHEKLIELAH
tara:strand:+ start:220 stop:1695 length:1476 start_codon:yes stop_codon:yes gene_type:complete